MSAGAIGYLLEVRGGLVGVVLPYCVWVEVIDGFSGDQL